MTEEVTEEALKGSWYCGPCKQPIEVTLTCIGKDKYRVQGDCPEEHHIDLVFTGEIKFLTKSELRGIAEMYLHVQLEDVEKQKQPDIYRDHVISGMFSLIGKIKEDFELQSSI